MSNETTASHRSFIELGRESVNIRLTNNIAVKRTRSTVSGTRKGRKEKREREREGGRELSLYFRSVSEALHDALHRITQA